MDSLLRKGLLQIAQGAQSRLYSERSRLRYLKQGWKAYKKSAKRWRYRIVVRYSDWMIDRGLGNLDRWHLSTFHLKRPWRR